MYVTEEEKYLFVCKDIREHSKAKILCDRQIAVCKHFFHSHCKIFEG